MGRFLRRIREEQVSRQLPSIEIPTDIELGPTPERPEGRINVYKCEACHGLTVTIDVDPGVTPSMIYCYASGTPGQCTGTAHSAFYPTGPRPDHIPPPAWEWYRPTSEELIKLNRQDKYKFDHVRQGGLLLRKRQVTNA